MFGSHALETAAGLAFIYFVLSTFVSAINEAIAAFFSLRARSLATALKNMLAQQSAPQTAVMAAAVGATPANPVAAAVTSTQAGWNLATAVLKHPIVENLSAPHMIGKGISGPSYLDAKTFSSVLVDLLAPGPDNSLAQFRASINSLQNTELRGTLLPLVDQASGDIDKARANIEAWYDAAMRRLGGAYKRRAQSILFALGLAMAVLLNIDTLRAARTLWTDPIVREQLLEQAKKPATDNATAPPADSAAKDLATKYVDEYASLAAPFGWSQTPAESWKNYMFGGWLSLVGWLLTALAISLGAPFWFDFLNNTLKLNARLSGEKPAKN